MDEKKRMEIKIALAKHVVTLPDGSSLPSLGQGTWYMGKIPK